MTLNLAAVIAQVESDGRDISPRFEPTLYYELAADPTPERGKIIGAIGTIHFCNQTTARMIAATSWGRYQILGENLYSVCQCSVDVFTLVNEPLEQDAMFENFVQARGIDFTIEDLIADSAKRTKFITAWNGPGNVQAYWTLMQNAIKTLGGPTIVGEST
jgi:hypothetical protein